MVMAHPDLDIGPHWLINPVEIAVVATATSDAAILVHVELDALFGVELSFAVLLFKSNDEIDWIATLSQEFIPMLCDLPFYNYTSTLHVWVPQGEEPFPNTVSEDDFDSALIQSQYLWNVANTIADSIPNTRSLRPQGQLLPLGDNITLPIERIKVTNHCDDADYISGGDDDAPDLPRTVAQGTYVPLTVSCGASYDVILIWL
jgi:hypothetical protein